MRLFLLLTTVLSPLLVFATKDVKPFVSGDVTEIHTVDSWKDTEFVPNVNPQFRYRAIVVAPLETEGGGVLMVEKLSQGEIGNPYQVFFSERVELAANKQMKEELKKLSGEALYGCCYARDVKWDKFKLTYKTRITNTYACEIENVNKSRSPKCVQVKE